MRFVNQGGRLLLKSGDRGVDVNVASGGDLPADPAAALRSWDAVIEWAHGFEGEFEVEIRDAELGPPSPSPNQIFGVGVNFADHLAESGMEQDESPLIFTKLLPSLAGPFDDIVLSATGTVDWEVEVVAVIGREAVNVESESAWGYVAGLTAGQDISDREIQMRPRSHPQFSLGKSLPSFGPIGPCLVTPEAFEDREDIELACSVNGEEMQRGRTSSLIQSIPQLVSYLSSVTPLLPGDLIFTGTPGGVGGAMSPPRFLADGDLLESYVEGVGRMSQKVVAA
jgi:2-keto-4-pentenoate hydratase/2-oxohepta-3-ene-1,7-dioic acid hydratase in catechol pathway